MKTKCRMEGLGLGFLSPESNTYGQREGADFTACPWGRGQCPYSSYPPLAFPGFSKELPFCLIMMARGRFSPYVGLTFLICKMGMCETSLRFLQPFSFRGQRPGRELYPSPHFLQKKQVEGRPCTSQRLSWDEEGPKVCMPWPHRGFIVLFTSRA